MGGLPNPLVTCCHDSLAGLRRAAVSTIVPFRGLTTTPNTIAEFPEIRIPGFSCRKSNSRNLVGKVGFRVCRFQLFKPAAPSPEIRQTTSLGPPRPNRPGRPRRQLVEQRVQPIDKGSAPRNASVVVRPSEEGPRQSVGQNPENLSAAGIFAFSPRCTIAKRKTVWAAPQGGPSGD